MSSMIAGVGGGGSKDDTIKDSYTIVSSEIRVDNYGTVICSVDDIKDYIYMVIQDKNGGSQNTTDYSGYTTIIPIPLLLYGVSFHSWMSGYYNTCQGQIYKSGNNIVIARGRGFGSGSTTLYGSVTVYR